MNGKVCLITGANSGIGKEAAISLAKAGFSLILVCRNKEKAEQTKYDIIYETGNENIDFMVADLSRQKDIHALAKEIKAKYKSIDVLINNAGGMNFERKLTVDNYEMTFAVNHLAYFLLTHLLLDLVKASSSGRIINVASAAHLKANLDFSDLQLKNYNGIEAYRKSKLANILFTYELADRLSGTSVTCNCMHPGVVSTNIWKNHSGFYGILGKVAMPFLKFLMLSPKKGSETIVYLTASEDVKNVTGRYFVKKKAVISSAVSRNRKIGKKLWEISEKLCNIKSYGVS